MSTQIGDAIPSWTMEHVDPVCMKTMAAILRDPYPVHWDRSANDALGIGGRVINQGPLNLSYVVNMLLDVSGRRAYGALPCRSVDRCSTGIELSPAGR